MTYEIIGAVKFSPNTFFNTLSPIRNVQVVLKNTLTNMVGCVSTDSFGNFRIFNIPEGNYILVESFGYPNSSTSPLDFGTVTLIDTLPILAMDPVVSAITPTPKGNTIFSLTPNTVNLDTSNFINNSTIVNFIDGSYTKMSEIDTTFAYSEINLITIVNGGTFGNNPPGTSANTSLSSQYISSDFTYEEYNETQPTSGSYTIINIANLGYDNGSNYNFADFTSGNETGNALLICNKFGDYIRENTIFTTTISDLTVNTNYLFNFWITALKINIENDSLEVFLKVQTSSNETIYDGQIFIASDYNFLVWEQVSSKINTLNNTTLIFTIYSYDSLYSNNLFSIDNISLNEIYPENPIRLSKTGRYSLDIENPEIYYDIKIEDTSTIVDIETIIIDDILPANCKFKVDSATFDGVSIPGNFPFTILDLQPNQVSTLSFTASIIGDLTLVPCNIATCEYSYELNSRTYNIKSKSLPMCLPPLLTTPNINLINSEEGAKLNEKITFTVSINNFYSNDFLKASLISPLNEELTFIEDSISINGVALSGESILPPYGIYLGTLPAFSSNIITFSAMAFTLPSPNLISTAVKLKFENPSTNSMVTITSNSVVNSIYQVIFDTTLSSYPSVAKQNEPITFLSSISNIGNILATSIIASITIPEGYEFVDNSIIINSDTKNNTSTTINSFNNKMVNTFSHNNILYIPLPNLSPLASETFSFKLLPINPLSNITEYFTNYSAWFTYNSFIKKTSNYRTSSLGTYVIINNNSITIIRSTTPCKAKLRSEILYTVVVKNANSSFSKVDCTLFEKLSCYTSFVQGSLCINGKKSGVINPALGIPLLSIPVGGSFTITYCITAKHVGIANSHSIGVIYDGTNPPYEQLSNITTNFIG